MADVTIHDVRKSYGRTEIIRGVSVDVPDGAFVVLVGPSGCGKSTLLRMIAGLEDIGEGIIRIGGRVINDVEPKHRDIAMVFQNYALYPHMTVAENMAFSLRLGGRPRAEQDAKVAEAARVLGLSDYLGRYPRELSGGQRQRVAMGRAMVRAPQVFLFDEPLSNLDAKLRVQMRLELKQLHARLRTTTIYVTHDQIEAMTMADRIVVMRDGRVEQMGPPLDLYDRPANLFVAGFLGSPAMNTFEGRISGGRFVGDGIALDLPDGLRSIADGQAVVAGVRPEKFVPDDGDGATSMTVDVVEPTGSDTSLTGTIGSTAVTVLLRDRIVVDPGSTLPVRADRAAVHLFDAGTGERIS
jgi:multiple sugar transport system ATP-binding protein